MWIIVYPLVTFRLSIVLSVLLYDFPIGIFKIFRVNYYHIQDSKCLLLYIILFHKFSILLFSPPRQPLCLYQARKVGSPLYICWRYQYASFYDFPLGFRTVPTA